MVLFFFSLLGAAVGSFLNVVIWRHARGETIRGRSRCDECERPLSAKELIPVISFVIQKGRCRHCGAALSWQYPLVEITAALAYALGGYFFIPPGAFNFWSLILLAILFTGIGAAIVVTVTDIRYKIIPNGAVFTLFLLGLMATLIRAYPQNITATILDIGAAAFFAAILWTVWFFSRGRGMGFGDVKLIPSTSLILGFPASLAAFLFSFWLGGIVAIVLLLLRRKGLTHQIPFGPFIIAGGILAYFASHNLTQLIGAEDLMRLFQK